MFAGSTAFSSTSSTASSTPSAPSSSTAASTTPATTPASSSFSFGAASSTFGAATSSTSGSTASTTSTSSSSLFGGSTAPTAAATPSSTGGSLFGGGAMKQTTNAFGGSTTGSCPFGGFGQPVAATAATSSGFGQPVASTTTSGSGGLFGAATTSGSGGLFGATSGGFGQPIAAATSTSGGGGLFGTTSGGFGQPVASTSGSGFGAATTSGGFGQPVAATTTSGGGFGTLSTTPAFGAPATAGFFRPPPPSSWGGASFGSPAGHFSSFTPTTERVNVSRLFDRRDLFPDVILQYQGQDIYAHKAILALGSPKFQKMFDDEHSTQPPMMQENKPVYLLDDEIKGLQFTDVSRVIKFCYTGCFDADLPLTRLIHIALVAEEFKMTSLSSTCQALCLYKVKAETSLEPILEALETAHQNGLVELKKGIMTYLASSNLGGTAEEFMRLDKDLLAELLLHVTGMLNPSPASCSFDFGSY